jgi:hypothetical protein
LDLLVFIGGKNENQLWQAKDFIQVPKRGEEREEFEGYR